MMPPFEIAVVGGGPIGLAVAIRTTELGLRTLVIDKRIAPIDKACGEGLMPAGVAHLQALGVIARLSRDECSPITGIRYTQEDGTIIDGRLPAPGGLGVRRLALSQALTDRAREAGVTFLHDEVIDCVRSADGMQLTLRESSVLARFVVAADGLHSPMRKRLGLDGEPRATRRFGLRRHYRVAPWSSLVEVHFAQGVEAYITPAGSERIGLAFLFEASQSHTDFDTLLARFPILQERLSGLPFDSEPRGLGPLHQTATRVVGDGCALVGDAAGYVDAITGEGITLGLDTADALARALPSLLAGHSTLAAYERFYARAFKRYAFSASGVLALAQRPRLRRVALRLLARIPGLFTLILRVLMSA